MTARAGTVSAVIPAHDARTFIAPAIDSVRAQTRPVDEIVVVDDRSSDGTADLIASRYGASVRLVCGSFGGAAAARNAGWRAARSEWIAFLDADDEWVPTKIEAALGALARHPQADWFFSDGAFEPEDGAPGLESWFKEHVDCPQEYFGRPLEALLQVNFIMTHTVVVRRALLESLGGFDEGLRQAEDLDLWIRLSRRSPAVALAEPLVRYRRRAGGLSSAARERLSGDEQVFARLVGDTTLAPALRRSAADRLSRVRFKLGFNALRDGDGAAARRHLAGAAQGPMPAWPVMWAWAASFLPGPVLRRARRWTAGKNALARPALRLKRATLRSEIGAASGGAR